MAGRMVVLRCSLRDGSGCAVKRHVSSYAALISGILALLKRPEIDPRHVEAYMRLEHSTLDGLPRWQFVNEVRIGVACIDEAGIESAEGCARSFGL